MNQTTNHKLNQSNIRPSKQLMSHSVIKVIKLSNDKANAQSINQPTLQTNKQAHKQQPIIKSNNQSNK